MLGHIMEASSALAKRMDGHVEVVRELEWYGYIIMFLNLLIFLPGLLFTSYTLGSVFPTLAIVEDPNPSPAYAPVSLGEHDEEDQPTPQPDGSIRKPDNNNTTTGLPGPTTTGPVTASIRRTSRLLYSFGGYRAYLRGIACAVAIGVSTAFVSLVFGSLPFVPAFVGTLAATLALVQLHTAWVHIVIGSQPVSAAFWRRLPEFRRTFDATALPVVAVWAANTASHYLPFVLAKVMGLPTWDPSEPGRVPEYKSDAAWKSSVVAVAGVAMTVFVVIPARVALVRVQASLLPVEQDAVVPFDRSFGGLVEPAIVGGKGYATARQALSSFSRASWVRLYKMYFKVFAISTAFVFLTLAVVIPEFILMSHKVTKDTPV